MSLLPVITKMAHWEKRVDAKYWWPQRSAMLEENRALEAYRSIRSAAEAILVSLQHQVTNQQQLLAVQSGQSGHGGVPASI